MKKVLIPVLLSSLLVSNLSSANDSFNNKCPDIQTCAKVVSELLGQKYIYDADVKGHGIGTPNLDITKDNAESLFTNMLFLNGFSRVPSGIPGVYQIVRTRDARDSAVPVVKIDYTAKSIPLPDNWDLYTLIYKAKYPDSLDQTARSIRSFMPASARVMSMDLSGSLYITDSAMNLKKLLSLILDNDQKPTTEMKKRWTEQEHERAQQRQFIQKERFDTNPQPPTPPNGQPSGKPSN